MREDGRRESPTYTTWRAMLQRCNDPKHPSYDHYGGAGVKVVARWRKFTNFLADMGERPAGKTLGRFTPFNDYGPGECSWQTSSQQNQGLNSHADHIVKINGTSRTKRAWARKLKITYDRLLTRIRLGWKEAAYTTPRGRPQGTNLVVQSSKSRRKRK